MGLPANALNLFMKESRFLVSLGSSTGSGSWFSGAGGSDRRTSISSFVCNAFSVCLVSSLEEGLTVSKLRVSWGFSLDVALDNFSRAFSQRTKMEILLLLALCLALTITLTLVESLRVYKRLSRSPWGLYSRSFISSAGSVRARLLTGLYIHV